MADRKLTPVGRIVAGNPMLREPVIDKKTNQQKLDKNQQPMFSSWMHLAIPKTDPGFPEFWAWVQQTAVGAWPGGESTWPAFAWKYIDGDTGVNTKNAPYNVKPGYAGCHVLKFSTTLPIPVVDNTPDRNPITDPNAIKTGYYIQVNAGVSGNMSTDSPGVYMNPDLVAFVGYGEEIIAQGADGKEVFGTAPMALPMGASATPLATAAPMAAAPMAAAPASVQPHPAILNAPVAIVYLVEGQQYSEAQLQGFGWTPEQIAVAPRAA